MVGSQSREIIAAVTAVHKLFNVDHLRMVFSHLHENHVLVGIISNCRLACASGMESDLVALWVFGDFQDFDEEVFEEWSNRAEELAVFRVIVLGSVKPSRNNLLSAIWRSRLEDVFQVPAVVAIYHSHGSVKEVGSLASRHSYIQISNRQSLPVGVMR